MRHIFLMRHAKSSWDEPGRDDFERPLSSRGRKAAQAMARAWAGHDWRPELVLCSAALRTRATYDILEPRLRGVPVQLDPALYEAGWENLLYRLSQTEDRLQSVLVIGHNPGLERLAGRLCGEQGEPQALERLDEKFSTGALAVLDFPLPHWAQLAPGTCHLATFLRPRDLEGMQD